MNDKDSFSDRVRVEVERLELILEEYRTIAYGSVGSIG